MFPVAFVETRVYFGQLFEIISNWFPRITKCFKKLLTPLTTFKNNLCFSNIQIDLKSLEKRELTKSNLLFDETQFFYQERAATLNF